MGYRDLILADPGLLSYWRLGDAAGPAANQVAGGASAANAGAAVFGAAGALAGDSDKAVTFTGAATSYLDAGDVLDFVGAAPWSLEAWLRWDGTGSGTWRVIFGKIRTAPTNDGLLLALPNTAGAKPQVRRWNNNVLQTATSGTDIATNGWTHVLATYDGANIRIYQDGVLTAGPTASAQAGVDTTAHFLIGADVTAGPSPFPGRIDEAAVYGRELPVADALEHYQVGSGAKGYGILVPGPRVDEPADRLSLSITRPDGSIKRWGPGEVAAADVPTALQFGSAIPGGFNTLQSDLLRRITKDYDDLDLLNDVRVYGPGNKTAWEGRLQAEPRSHQDQFKITPQAVGWSAHLKDDNTFREIYVDRDLNAWSAISRARRGAYGTRKNGDDPSVIPDPGSGLPCLRVGWSDAWTNDVMAEAMYDAQGIPLDRLYYDYVARNINTADAQWLIAFFLSVDDIWTPTVDSSGDLAASGSGAGYVVATDALKKYLAIQFYYGAAGGGGLTYELQCRKLAAYGRHGLTRRGADPGGFYPSDVIADVVKRAAPLLNFSTGSVGSIQDNTSLIIPHLAYKDPTTAEQVILDVNVYALWDWGVYDGRTFFFRPPDPDRLTWEIRLSEGAQLDLEGQQVDDQYNGVVVGWTDAAGTKWTIGPADANPRVIDASLRDNSDTNPVNAAGIPRKYGQLEIQPITSQGAALAIGQLWLAEQKLAQRRGSAVFARARHPSGARRPAWWVRAGDYVRVSDHPADVPRKVIETNYDATTKLNTATLDNTSQKVTAILEALGVALVGVIS